MFAASAATKFTLNIASEVTIAGTKVKPGEYKVEVVGSEATFKVGGKSFKLPTSVEKDTKVNKVTTIEASGLEIRAIHVEHSDTKLVFHDASPVTGGTN
jgi:hypothetical protein